MTSWKPMLIGVAAMAITIFVYIAFGFDAPTLGS
jgi:hypothetical protein